MSRLLSPETPLEWLAQTAHTQTVQRFGHVMQLFAPLYLSNLCYNHCTYCGFSVVNKYPRKTLTMTELMAECAVLHNQGFRHSLLLTGEAPGAVDVPYISQAIAVAKRYFTSVGIEIQPMNQADYTALINAGADSLTLYQETYHRPTYLHHHKKGKKRNYDHRLAAVDAGAKAGFHRLTLGFLLGLYDWRAEALALAQHLTRLRTDYPAVTFGVSFPRIQDMIGEYTVAYPVSDADLVRLITAFRLVFPDVSITLSTRERPELRDNLVKLGITLMSAASKTNPGGYAGQDSESQFEIADHRSCQAIAMMLKTKGYCPVYTDWV